MEMLQKIRSVIVEDESAAREALKNYLAKYCPVIEVVGEAHDCKSAVLYSMNWNRNWCFWMWKCPTAMHSTYWKDVKTCISKPYLSPPFLNIHSGR